MALTSLAVGAAYTGQFFKPGAILILVVHDILAILLLNRSFRFEDIVEFVAVDCRSYRLFLVNITVGAVVPTECVLIDFCHKALR
jgi:hypothetical protein